MENEIWKDVVGFEGYYQVSNLGRVKGLDRVVKYRHRTLSVKGRIIVPNFSSRYVSVTMSMAGTKRKQKTIHRMVAIAFVQNPENKKEVNHIDGDRSNNRSENLEWCTAKENIAHAFNKGLMGVRKGQKVGIPKLTEDIVIEIRRLHSNKEMSNAKIAKKYKIHTGTVADIINRKNWKHI